MRLNVIRYVSVTLFILTAYLPAQHQPFNEILDSLRRQYAPDTRIAVFDVSCKETKGEMILQGEVDYFAAKNAVIAILRTKTNKTLVDKIGVLPDPALGKDTNGIVHVTVGSVYRKPGRHNELITQVLMGSDVKILKKKNGFFFIRMSDNYLGWIQAADLIVTDENGLKNWNQKPRVIVTAREGVVYSAAGTASKSVCRVVEGSVLKFSGKQNGWIEVNLADGRKGFVPDPFVQDLDEWNRTRKLDSEHLETTAKSFLGIPYLWGGTSINGMDCSGFVKMVYRMNGLELSRDANQQAEQGTSVEPGTNFQNLLKGDLLFFGTSEAPKQHERITHVGMYLENGMFIHSSGNVHYGSFDSLSPYFDRSLLARFVRARRIISP